jgi:hypothetical protein
MNINQLSQTIYKLYPQVTVIRGDVAYDANNNVVVYDTEAVQAYVDSHAYIAKRQAEYPTLADFADAYYWSQNGDNTKMTAYLEKCDEVKSKYPKP